MRSSIQYCKAFVIILALFHFNGLRGQDQVNFKIHSHNDYEQNIPFWNAYGNGLNSIEIDVFLIDDELFVAHHKNEVLQNRTIESLYLRPLRKAIDLKLGEQQPIQILIDIKTEAVPTLESLIKTLKKYPDLIESDKITFVISGNRPEPAKYIDYPEFIQFDYQSLESIPSISWDKVALISLPFSRYSNWDGAEAISSMDQEEILEVIDQAHNYNKPFRFWGTPDTELAWSTFVKLGIDFINTDKPYACSQYLSTLR